MHSVDFYNPSFFFGSITANYIKITLFSQHIRMTVNIFIINTLFRGHGDHRSINFGKLNGYLIVRIDHWMVFWVRVSEAFIRAEGSRYFAQLELYFRIFLIRQFIVRGTLSLAVARVALTDHDLTFTKILSRKLKKIFCRNQRCCWLLILVALVTFTPSCLIIGRRYLMYLQSRGFFWVNFLSLCYIELTTLLLI